MPPSKVAWSKISNFFQANGTRAYCQNDFRNLLAQFGSDWHIPQYVTYRKFLAALLDKTELHEVVLRSDSYPAVTRYVWGQNVSPVSLAMSIKRGCYLSHGTALWLHRVSELGQIYVNSEQSPKPKPKGELTQGGIDNAFENQQRTSRLTYVCQGKTIVVLNGKASGRLGVMKSVAPSGEAVDVTTPERTLVDIAVRPAYAGGVRVVIGAYEKLRASAEMTKICDILRELDYVYPYHQAVGFYAERAGWAENQLKMLRDFGMHLNFYLDYGMENPALDINWRVFYPKGIL